MSEFRRFDHDGRAISITRSQARDHRAWQRARAEADKLNVELVVIPDPAQTPQRFELDSDGAATSESGTRFLPIPRSAARDHRRYMTLRDKAQSLGMPWAIVDDNQLIVPRDPGPEAA